MKYYFSGIGTFKGDLLDRIAHECPWRLQSCHGAYVKNCFKWGELASRREGHCEMLLDSGAFTAWSKGDSVDLDALMRVYGKFIDQYEDKLKAIWLINLDRIPGSPGRTAGTAELEAAIEESDRNFEILVKEFGDRVLPVFHQNEAKERLAEVARMAEYICISPRNDLPEKNRVTWSAEVHKLIPNSKTHGLATTGGRMVQGVPWYSADSASWVFAGAMGNITVMSGDKLVPVSVSSESPAMKDMGKHISTVSSHFKDYVAERAEHHGFNLTELSEGHGERMAFNMLETLEWVNSVSKVPLPTSSLFDF